MHNNGWVQRALLLLGQEGIVPHESYVRVFINARPQSPVSSDSIFPANAECLHPLCPRGTFIGKDRCYCQWRLKNVWQFLA